MPCPPSYEELEMANLDRSTNRLCQSLPILKDQSKETLATVEILKEVSIQNNIPEKVLKEFDPMIQEIKKVADFDLEALLVSPELSGGWPTKEDVERMQKYRDRILKPHNELELLLCKSRQLIYQIWMRFEELGIPFRSALGELLTQEKDRHLQHRKEDREEEIKRLKNTGSYFRVQIRLHKQGKLKGDLSTFNYHAELEYLEQKIKRIQAFSDHEILNDRLLFFRE